MTTGRATTTTTGRATTMAARQALTRSFGLVGAGIGLALYAVFGLMQGAAMGGTLGIILANKIYGPGAIELNAGDLATRVLVGGSMLAGTLVALIMFLVAGTALGSSLGFITGLLISEKKPGLPAETADKSGM